MKFPYAVKHNGSYYRPNTEIPEEKASVEPEEKPVKKESPKKKGGDK